MNTVCISAKMSTPEENTGRPLHFKKYGEMSTHGFTPMILLSYAQELAQLQHVLNPLKCSCVRRLHLSAIQV